MSDSGGSWNVTTAVLVGRFGAVGPNNDGDGFGACVRRKTVAGRRRCLRDVVVTRRQTRDAHLSDVWVLVASAVESDRRLSGHWPPPSVETLPGRSLRARAPAGALRPPIPLRRRASRFPTATAVIGSIVLRSIVECTTGFPAGRSGSACAVAAPEGTGVDGRWSPSLGGGEAENASV